MRKSRKNQGVMIGASTGNVYADLGYPASDSLQIKAQLVTEIAGIMKARKLTQEQAARALGLTQPKVSRMLKGQFRGISERRLLDCLTRLGRDVKIIVRVATPSRDTGRISIHFP